MISTVVPASLPWISLYWLFALVSLLMVVVIGLSRFPKVELSEEERAGALKVHQQLLKKPIVILFFIGIFCYVGTEQGVANWISQFLYVYHGYDPQTTGAQAVAYFWGLMTAGGVVGLFLFKDHGFPQGADYFYRLSHPLSHDGPLRARETVAGIAIHGGISSPRSCTRSFSPWR